MGRLGSTRLREAVFLVIGTSTPIGILAVNGSAFIMQHLSQFQVAIAVCALISGLSLNGLTAWVAIGRAERFAPRLFAEYRTWLVVTGVVIVVGFSALGAYGTYVSMQSPKQLPNLYAVLTALWLLLLPVIMTFIGRRLKLQAGKKERARAAQQARPASAEVLRNS